MRMEDRPRSWYKMSYDQQRKYEKRQDQHNQEIEDAQYREEQQRESAEAAWEEADRRKSHHRTVAAEMSDTIDSLSEENETLRAQRDELLKACEVLVSPKYRTDRCNDPTCLVCQEQNAILAKAQAAIVNAKERIEGE